MTEENPFAARRLQEQLRKELGMKSKPKDSRRDIMLHSAVTIMNRYKGVELLSEQENEISQFAVEISADKIPIPEQHIRTAWNDMMERNISRMRAYGLVK